MAKIDKHIDINATGEEVFGVLTDLDLLPSWSTITTETHGTPPKPLSEETLLSSPSGSSAAPSSPPGGSPISAHRRRWPTRPRRWAGGRCGWSRR
jgi:hypothetical protein